MKVWAIVATVLLVATIGVGSWFYVQNKDLKSQKSKVETELASVKASQEQSDVKKATASKKIGLLTTIFSGMSSQEDSLVVYDTIKSFNDETLTADWKAMTSSQPGDNTGNKLMTDLLASAINDLK